MIAIAREGVASPADTSAATSRLRLVEVDRLRGLVIVLMALDHVRDYFSPTGDPTDLAHVDWELFLTRWVTHFCAPVFVFLAGTSAFLQREARGWTTGEARRQLLLRGALLVLLEVTWVSSSWFMGPGFVLLQVIWAIGVSMIALGLLCGLPRGVLLALGLAIVLGHNLLDGVKADTLGAWSVPWALLHEPRLVAEYAFLAYPVLPWIGVMLLGWCFAPILLADRGESTWRRTLAIGAVAIALFLVLRGLNVYGDPVAWGPNARGALYTALGVLDTEKYPPSLAYLLMTLGPALLALPLFARGTGGAWRPLETLGRVPMFFYLIHIAFIHGLARLWNWHRYDAIGWMSLDASAAPPGYEPSLLRTYVVWALVVVALYPVCAWYAERKRRHPDRWWARWI